MVKIFSALSMALALALGTLMLSGTRLVSNGLASAPSSAPQGASCCDSEIEKAISDKLASVFSTNTNTGRNFSGENATAKVKMYILVRSSEIKLFGFATNKVGKPDGTVKAEVIKLVNDAVTAAGCTRTVIDKLETKAGSTGCKSGMVQCGGVCVEGTSC